ncbi:hypothetical protein NQZ68_002631 [Dissostichus eleginoides]|nr:hypothetical protein NQZ68_002631 [Dissostichus eleginoides]
MAGGREREHEQGFPLLTPPIASEGPAGPPAQKVNATWRDCEPPRGFWDSHMARQICQGGPVTPGWVPCWATRS